MIAWFDAHLPGFLAGQPGRERVGVDSRLPLLGEAPSFVPRDPEAGRAGCCCSRTSRPTPAPTGTGSAPGRKEIDGSGVMRTVWCGPWIPTIIGTDTYTDQLW